ncbi:MAG TPA: hypothetical protein VHY09_07555 [Candidatus Methylacidiphilales bacterium]|nr:hypothetical protein [Candidatus Methylacidiphilales bacterium]
MHPFTWRAFLERGCLAAWMVLMAINTIVLGLAVELFVFGTILSFGEILLINSQTAPLLVCGVFALLNFPLVARLREYGVANLNFELHEMALNRMMTPPESWSNTIMALLDEAAAESGKLELMIRLIDEAPGPVERQERRAEAKAWLKENREKLTEEDRELARERLGYLWS